MAEFVPRGTGLRTTSSPRPGSGTGTPNYNNVNSSSPQNGRSSSPQDQGQQLEMEMQLQQMRLQNLQLQEHLLMQQAQAQAHAQSYAMAQQRWLQQNLGSNAGGNSGRQGSGGGNNGRNQQGRIDAYSQAMGVSSMGMSSFSSGTGGIQAMAPVSEGAMGGMQGLSRAQQLAILQEQQHRQQLAQQQQLQQQQQLLAGGGTQQDDLLWEEQEQAQGTQAHHQAELEKAWLYQQLQRSAAQEYAPTEEVVEAAAILERLALSENRNDRLAAAALYRRYGDQALEVLEAAIIEQRQQERAAATMTEQEFAHYSGSGNTPGIILSGPDETYPITGGEDPNQALGNQTPRLAVKTADVLRKDRNRTPSPQSAGARSARQKAPKEKSPHRHTNSLSSTSSSEEESSVTSSRSERTSYESNNTNASKTSSLESLAEKFALGGAQAAAFAEEVGMGPGGKRSVSASLGLGRPSQAAGLNAALSGASQRHSTWNPEGVKTSQGLNPFASTFSPSSTTAASAPSVAAPVLTPTPGPSTSPPSSGPTSASASGPASGLTSSSSTPAPSSAAPPTNYRNLAAGGGGTTPNLNHHQNGYIVALPIRAPKGPASEKDLPSKNFAGMARKKAVAFLGHRIPSPTNPPAISFQAQQDAMISNAKKQGFNLIVPGYGPIETEA